MERPDAIEEAEEAIEIVRAWVADEHLQATLDPLVFEDPAIWGQLLAELARQVAITWAEESSQDASETFSGIVQAFLDEASAGDAEDSDEEDSDPEDSASEEE